jgi:hypothetical protein
MIARLAARHLLALILLGCLPLLSGPLVSRLSAVPGPSAAVPATADPLPSLPIGWPSTLQLGMSDGLGGAAAMQATSSFGFRYQYLAGGVNTGSGWASWNPNGDFVTYYIQESIEHAIIPVFTYYMLVQSSPGSTQSEGSSVAANLQNTETMTAYYHDVKLFFQRAGAFPDTRVVLHVEPDLWGFTQQRAIRDHGRTVPAQVAATGVPELAGLTDDISGFARSISRLRDMYAPNVLLGYHLSTWGTGSDLLYSKPSGAMVDALAARAGQYYLSLQSDFDLVFAEFADRDTAYKQYVYGDGGRSWWAADDFSRHVRFLATFASTVQKPMVLWQIPFGNTRMRAMNNTWNHYQDNRVEWLIDDPTRGHLDAYLRAGVVALLFGGGAAGTTCACDAAGDGVTNPEPINGNIGWSLNSDDDGGFFRQKAGDYYATGAITLPAGLPALTSAAQQDSPVGLARPMGGPSQYGELEPIMNPAGHLLYGAEVQPARNGDGVYIGSASRAESEPTGTPSGMPHWQISP